MIASFAYIRILGEEKNRKQKKTSHDQHFVSGKFLPCGNKMFGI
jgi:hypothetical protein